MRVSFSHRWFEPALAALLVVLAELELLIYGLLDTPAEAVVAAATAAPVALRFRRPLTALSLSGIAGAIASTQADNTGQTLIPTVSVLLCLYAIGSQLEGWRFWAGGLIAGVLVATGLILREGVTSDLALAVGVPVAGLLIGRAAGVLELETEVLERERDEHTRQAIQLERSRIARELHDVIGHSISVMGLQAGAVRSVLPPERTREREALLAVERVGRDAVGEMRRLIGLLRVDDEGLEGPSPSLARAGALADDMRGAGQRLDLQVEGEVGDLAPGVDLAGYRILQEALTNALKHAPGANVTALVRRAGDVLEIDVADDGTAPPPSNGHVGHGLVGMRERAALYGGEVTAGPGDRGGFRVHAHLAVGAA